MFCAGCGSQIQTGLNYCSRCGRRVAENDPKTARRMSPLVIAGNTAGVGFVAYIFVLFVLSRSGVAPTVYVPLTFFYFAALFALCFLFLRQGRSTASNMSVQQSEDMPAPAYLGPVTTAQLEEASDLGIGSVTDATTRTLDKTPNRKL